MPDPVVGLRGEGDARQQAAETVRAYIKGAPWRGEPPWEAQEKAEAALDLLLVRVQEAERARKRAERVANEALDLAAEVYWFANHEPNTKMVKAKIAAYRAVLGGDVQEPSA